MNYLTNESLMELTQVPEHLIVLGRGYIGLEFGADVSAVSADRITIVHLGKQVLDNEDARANRAGRCRKALSWEEEGWRSISPGIRTR